MKSLVFAVLFVLIAGACCAPKRKTATSAPTVSSTNTDCDLKVWAKFKKDYKRRYEGTQVEENHKKIFCDNLREINEHNARYDLGKETYKKGINNFADMTSEQWQATYLTAN